jgi:hypothetical protein
MWWDDVTMRLARIEYKLNLLLTKENKLMATVADIQAAVAAEKTVEDSAVTLLQQLTTLLKDAVAANDPVALQAVVDSLTANSAALASAVTANTPAAP